MAALIAVLLLSAVHGVTRRSIAAAEARYRVAQIVAVLPSLRAPVRSVPLTAPSSPIHRLSRVYDTSGKEALLIEATAAAGYNGPIELMIGVRDNTIVDGVRVIAHRETPGIGDPIERERSNWIEQFRDRSLDDPVAQRWSVARPDAAFDALSGATITSAAVVEGVYASLRTLVDTAGRGR